MSYTRSNLPLWARALVGGVAMLAGAVTVAAAATWNPSAAWLRGAPEIAVCSGLSVLGLVLVGYGTRVRRRPETNASVIPDCGLRRT